MESSSIRTLVVDTLENVEFTTERPVEGINLPDRGPGTTSLRHMADIESVSGRTISVGDGAVSNGGHLHSNMLLVVLLGPKTNGITTGSVRPQDSRAIGTKDERITSAEGEVLRLCSGTINVIPIGGSVNGQRENMETKD
jgi:hypothetical protein